MENTSWWRKVVEDAERQQRELKRLKERSEELLERPPVERRIAELPVIVERRRKTKSG